MKKIFENKEKLGEYETNALIEECSAILQKKLPPKFKDLGSFKISCYIGNVIFEKTLCDLGENINLKPLSLFRKLRLGEVKATIVTLQLVDRSLKHPIGIIENVLVKVGKYIFPMDFIVLEMEKDKKIQLYLANHSWPRKSSH